MRTRDPVELLQAVDSYQPFLNRLRRRAKEKALDHLVLTTDGQRLNVFRLPNTDFARLEIDFVELAGL